MIARLKALIRLQAADDLLRQERRVLAEAGARLAAARAALDKAEKILASQRELQAAEEARRRQWEGEAADLAEKKKKNAGRLATAKNESEYAALNKEADFLAKKLSELEDAALALMDGMDLREVEIAALAAAAADERAAFAALEVRSEAEKKAAEARIMDLAARRDLSGQALGPAILKQYEETAQVKGGLSVTAAAGGLCLACRLSFPPQFYNDLQRNEKILLCPNCGRFIYWRDHPDFQEFSEEPAGSKADPGAGGVLPAIPDGDRLSRE